MAAPSATTATRFHNIRHGGSMALLPVLTAAATGKRPVEDARLVGLASFWANGTKPEISVTESFVDIAKTLILLHVQQFPMPARKIKEMKEVELHQVARTLHREMATLLRTALSSGEVPKLGQPGVVEKMMYKLSGWGVNVEGFLNEKSCFGSTPLIYAIDMRAKRIQIDPIIANASDAELNNAVNYLLKTNSKTGYPRYAHLPVAADAIQKAQQLRLLRRAPLQAPATAANSPSSS